MSNELEKQLQKEFEEKKATFVKRKQQVTKVTNETMAGEYRCACELVGDVHNSYCQKKSPHHLAKDCQADLYKRVMVNMKSLQTLTAPVFVHEAQVYNYDQETCTRVIYRLKNEGFTHAHKSVDLKTMHHANPTFVIDLGMGVSASLIVRELWVLSLILLIVYFNCINMCTSTPCSYNNAANFYDLCFTFVGFLSLSGGGILLSFGFSIFMCMDQHVGSRNYNAKSLEKLRNYNCKSIE